MTPRRQPLASFNIFDVCREGLMLLLAHRVVLARLSLFPLGAVLVSGVLLSQMDTAIFPLRSFLYGLPGEAATGWLIFIAVRLWLLGETPATASPDASDRADRALLMQNSIILFLLWKAAMAVYEQVFFILIPPSAIADPTLLEQSPATTFGLMILLGVLFWALRFRLLPVLAAVGYPLRDYAVVATGLGLSFRLLGLVAICAYFPRMLVTFMLLPVLGKSILVVLVVQAVGMLLELWLFAAFTVALRQMLGRSARA